MSILTACIKVSNSFSFFRKKFAVVHVYYVDDFFLAILLLLL